MSDKILWSDESNFHLFGSRRQFVRKRSNEKLHKGCVAKTKKYGGDHILVWGCFSRKGVGILRCITGNLNSDGYLELLQTAMLPSARTMFPDGDFIYQQDGAPCHRLASVRKWFNDHDISVLDWPAQSPDISPIENLWSILKHRVRHQKPKTLDKL